MNLTEAIACLADYNANPLPWHNDELDQYASLESSDGIHFNICLADYEGASDVFETVQQYHDRIKVLRARGPHRWCISDRFCWVEAAGEGATCVEGQKTR